MNGFQFDKLSKTERQNPDTNWESSWQLCTPYTAASFPPAAQPSIHSGKTAKSPQQHCHHCDQLHVVHWAITKFHTKFAQSRTFFLLNTIAQTRTFFIVQFRTFFRQNSHEGTVKTNWGVCIG